MKQITIYPDDALLEQIIDEATTEKRSVNSQILYTLEENYKFQQDLKKQLEDKDKCQTR